MKLLIITQVVDTEHPILGFFVRWIEEFARHCESVIVICLQEGKHDLPKNVRVRSLGKEEGVSRLKYLARFYSYIWRERNHYDAVFVHMNQIHIILGALVWRLLGKRISLWYMHKHVSLSLRCATLLTHRVFTASLESFRVRSRKIQCVGHGIDTDAFSYSEHGTHDPMRLVTVGRVSPVKNLEVLIDVIAAVHARDMACTFTIVGDADSESQHAYKHQLIQQMRGRDLESAVTWKGTQEQKYIPNILREHDVFLHASDTGSLDKSILEALSCGTLPVTADPTLSRDLPDDLKPLCIAKRNDVESYVRALFSIRALSGAESERLRRMGRDYVEHHHSLAKLIPKIISVL